MNILFAGAFILIQSIITLCHYALYRVLADFTVLPYKLHTPLFIILIGLSFVFTLSNILIRFYPSKFSSVLYTWSAIWMGTFHFLFLATIFIAIISVFKYETAGFKLFSSAILLISIGVSLYGYYHSKQTKIVHYDVFLKNLPASWEGVRAAFIADTHYGIILNQNEAQRLVTQITAEKPDILFVSGDFYDGPKIDFKAVASLYTQLNPRLGKFFVTGNHEEYAGRTETEEALEQAGFIITDKQSTTLVDGLTVVGIPYNQSETIEDMRSFLNTLSLQNDKPNIILKHVPNHLEAFSDGANLVLSGHTHRGQVWPFMYLTRYVYKGFDYGLHSFNEAQIITTSGVGTWGPPQRVGTQSELVIITFHKK